MKTIEQLCEDQIRDAFANYEGVMKDQARAWYMAGAQAATKANAIQTLTLKIDTSEVTKAIDAVVAEMENGKVMYVSHNEFKDFSRLGRNMLTFCAVPVPGYEKRVLLVELPE